MIHLRASDYRVLPWKDGGGSSTEIAIEPRGSSLSEPFLWRVSSARVAASGPFSRFPGYQRCLVLLEGAGLILDRAGKPRERLKRFEHPFWFRGEDAISATLIQGPCLDFGVISDPALVKTAVQAFRLGPDATSLQLAPTTLVYAPQGHVRVDPFGTHLEPGESLVLGGTDAAPKTPTGGSRIGLRGIMPATPIVVVSFWPV